MVMLDRRRVGRAREARAGWKQARPVDAESYRVVAQPFGELEVGIEVVVLVGAVVSVLAGEIGRRLLPLMPIALVELALDLVGRGGGAPEKTGGKWFERRVERIGRRAAQPRLRQTAQHENWFQKTSGCGVRGAGRAGVTAVSEAGEPPVKTIIGGAPTERRRRPSRRLRRKRGRRTDSQRSGALPAESGRA